MLPVSQKRCSSIAAKKSKFNEGANALVEIEKITAEKVLPRGLEPGVSCLRCLSSETDGLPGLELAKTNCLREVWGALKHYSITPPAP
jgi:hypothetical protein